jgi:hypothetical protein
VRKKGSNPAQKAPPNVKAQNRSNIETEFHSKVSGKHEMIEGGG